jgi:hypothetical protein
MKVGRDNSAGIATRYGLDVPGVESRWGARFWTPVQTGPGAHPVSFTVGTGSFPGVKRPGRGLDHPPLSSADVEERVELYLYSPAGSSWPVLGWDLLYLLYMRTSLNFTAAGDINCTAADDINSPYRCLHRVKWCHAVRTVEEAQILHERPTALHYTYDVNCLINHK